MIVIISDVSVGYGTPQLIRLAEAIVEKFSIKVLIIEPDQSERRPIDSRDTRFPNSISIRRVYTGTHPNSLSGTIQYVKAIVGILEQADLSAIIVSSEKHLPILEFVPSTVVKVFYCLEHIEHPSLINATLYGEIDIFIFPEANRRRIYLERISTVKQSAKSFVVYNANYNQPSCDLKEKKPKFFYGGTFHETLTMGKYFMSEEAMRFPIDIYGIIDGFADNSSVYKKLTKSDSGVSYKGYLPSNANYFKTLSKYFYSIVIWSPDREDRYYACPNKVFDAIACGVPPICAPHPQCVEMINRWKCGVLMADWSHSSFIAALRIAAKLSQGSGYAEMVSACGEAMRGGLDWSSQISAVLSEFRVRGLGPDA